MSDLQALQAEADKIQGLINEAGNALQMPVSHLRTDFEKSCSKAAPRIAVELQKAVSRGKVEEIVIAGAFLGVAYVGAWGMDAIRNTQAQNKARNALTGYYQELAVKQNLLIEEQRRILGELNNSKNMLQAERTALQKKYNQVEAICKKITVAMRDKIV